MTCKSLGRPWTAPLHARRVPFPPPPLASKHFAYPTGIPYQVDTEPYLIRGGQTGYNQCNSTTEGSGSLCQTSFLSALDAWARDASYTPGALQGVQFMKTPDYVQVVGFIDQTKINLQADDSGGELDLRGNPLGSLVYSTAWGSGTEYTQVIEWHNFMGGSQFCFKACDPSKSNAANYCQHIYDRIGCAYNAPNNAQNGTFESCLGENQDFPGVYTTDGQVMTYKQPPESLGPISTLPYTARVPASSSCTQYTSSLLFSALGTATSSASATATDSGSGGSGGGGAAKTGSQTKSGASAGASASATGTGGADTLSVSLVSGVLGVVFAAVFLA
ncbi:hypothetical protein B0H14DRAFT_3086953 [Mycena olivaceomarginata]|nr:hypothetical protein B0H14DRAFT_3086953 [Mycena olivaceomarginata]